MAYAPSPRHLRSLLSAGGVVLRAVVCDVVLVVSCVVLFLLRVCVCDLFLLLQKLPNTRTPTTILIYESTLGLPTKPV